MLFLKSIILYGRIDADTEILVYTSTAFMDKIKNTYNLNYIQFETNDLIKNVSQACKARLDLFKLESIKKYDKILYLDTDIIIKGDLNDVFNLCKDDVLYVLEEGNLEEENHDDHGKILFGEDISIYDDKSAFTSGIMLFNNCEKIKTLFEEINKCMIEKPYNFACHDQPYIVYIAFKQMMFNNKLLKSYAINNCTNYKSDKIIHHFPGGPGDYTLKLPTMYTFLNNLVHNRVISE